MVRFLLWCWAFTIPVPLRGVKGFRVAVLIPIAGLVLIIGALLSFAVGPFADATGIKPDVSRALLVIAGIVLLFFTGWGSNLYNKQYPGKFNYRLDEYVARRVSRLRKEEYIPTFVTQTSATRRQISSLTRKVRGALKYELARLKQTTLTTPVPLFGVLVIGPSGSQKTAALWNAMAKELKGWTFIRWPHHMDHSPDLTIRMGQRIALWLDDLPDFANPGEAASLLEFVGQLADTGREIMVLGSGRSRGDIEQARQYLRPLIDGRTSTQAGNPVAFSQVEADKLAAEYKRLPSTQKTVINSMNWLVSAGIHTFPYRVIEILAPSFPETLKPDEESRQVTGAIIDKLSKNKAGFITSQSQVDAEKRLNVQNSLVERMWYRVRIRWLKLRRKTPPGSRVAVPLKYWYLDFKKLVKAEELKTSETLVKNPQAIITGFAGNTPAIETLILLGDSYLSPRRVELANAADLALLCYDEAYKRLQDPKLLVTYPVAWAAALLGKANAELRQGAVSAARDDYQRLVKQTSITIPKMLLARAWNGSGDAAYAIAMREPRMLATRELTQAESDYEQAAKLVRDSDPLSGKTKLDRANVLFALAEAASNEYQQSRSASAGAAPAGITRQELEEKLERTERAYQEAQRAFTRTAAPAVWAEIRRRIGDLGLYRLSLDLPDTMLLLPTMARDATTRAFRVAPGNLISRLSDPDATLGLAQQVRDCFRDALEVFTPTYLPVSWAGTHMSLGRTLLIIAPLIARSDGARAEEIYTQCLVNLGKLIESVYQSSQAPLEWVDIQSMCAEAYIGRCIFDNAGPGSDIGIAKQCLDAGYETCTGLRNVKNVRATERMGRQEQRINQLLRLIPS